MHRYRFLRDFPLNAVSSRMQVSIMQRDSGTYCDEPEDQEDFAKFKEGFNVGDRKSDIDSLIKVGPCISFLQPQTPGASSVALMVSRDSHSTLNRDRLIATVDMCPGQCVHGGAAKPDCSPHSRPRSLLESIFLSPVQASGERFGCECDRSLQTVSPFLCELLKDWASAAGTGKAQAAASAGTTCSTACSRRRRPWLG